MHSVMVFRRLWKEWCQVDFREGTVPGCVSCAPAWRWRGRRTCLELSANLFLRRLLLLHFHGKLDQPACMPCSLHWNWPITLPRGYQ